MVCADAFVRSSVPSVSPKQGLISCIDTYLVRIASRIAVYYICEPLYLLPRRLRRLHRSEVWVELGVSGSSAKVTAWVCG